MDQLFNTDLKSLGTLILLFWFILCASLTIKY